MNQEKALSIFKENNILKSIRENFIYILEFIVTTIFMISLFEFVYAKRYTIEYPAKPFIICCMTGMIWAGVIFYTFIKNRDKIEKIFLAIAIPIGLAYWIFLIPGYAPDENAHLYRSYEISKGIFVTQVNEEDRIRSNVPVFFLENSFRTLNNYWHLNYTLDLETDYSKEEEVLSPAYSYFPTLYLPNALMFLIGRIFSINGIITFYMAKMVNLIVFLICGYYTIKLMPFGKILMMTYMLIPMAIHQSASLSADCITNAISLLFIAYALNLYFKEKIIIKNKIWYAVLAMLISIHKVAYFPIVLITFIFLMTKNMDKKQQIKFISIIIILGLISGLAWIGVCSRGTKDMDEYAITNNINPGQQVKHILNHPIKHIKTVVNTIVKWIENYYVGFMGKNLGWLNIPIKRVLIDMYFILLLFSPFVEKQEKELNKRSKLIFFLTFLIAVMAVFTALYIGNTGVGRIDIRGIQGRYFMPIVILALIPLCGKEKYIKSKHIQIIYPVLIMLLNYNVLVEMVTRFL